MQWEVGMLYPAIRGFFSGLMHGDYNIALIMVALIVVGFVAYNNEYEKHK